MALKPVSFNDETDKKMLDHIDSVGMGFTAYVKKLINEDMERASKNDELSDLVKAVTEMAKLNMSIPKMMMDMQNTLNDIKKSGITVNSSSTNNIEEEVEKEEDGKPTEEQRQIISGLSRFMNTGKK